VPAIDSTYSEGLRMDSSQEHEVRETRTRCR